MGGRYRLVTKSDFDGLVCGMLLKELGLLESVAFVHPKDVESGKFKVTAGDITAGLPYQDDAHLAFDHYPSAHKPAVDKHNLKVDTRAPSTARVIFNHYGAERFAGIHDDILDAVDKGFSARIASEEILYPTGWTLLSYLIDTRTGLEQFKRFRASHDELIVELMDEAKRRTVWELLSIPDVEERLELYFACIDEYKGQILRCASVHSNLVLTDMRQEERIVPGNKFMTYALFPECNVSMHVSSTGKSGRAFFAAGKSVLDRTCPLDIGSIMKRYGGGGHAGAGACHAEHEIAEQVRAGLLNDLQCGFFENLWMGYYNYF
ncbi:MAG TPA: exopolyphosphatase [Elusimicrobia bacterium]|nr:exopolyphosphatase [Elusimicrobiota bacterium]